MAKILTLKKVLPSGSHNATYTVENGYHWPIGERFRQLPSSHWAYRSIYTRDGVIWLEQIGGENTIVSCLRSRIQELFG